MNHVDWEKVQEIFEGAIALPAEDRENYLIQQCGDNDSLAKEVKSLLQADEDEHLDKKLFNAVPSHNQHSLTRGQSIGPYEILDEIGAGGMGVVYKGFDTRLQRNVAIKLLSAHLLRDEGLKQRFTSEARAASRLDHPNICTIYDFSAQEDDMMFLIMAYYDGDTLAERISKGSLTQQEALSIARQVGQGLSAAHDQGIVHRDIKPSNIMLTQEGRAKILDFGVAKVADTDLTSTGATVGTLGYSSPEQLRGEDVDARSDIWALGATLYEMLTGRKAFPGKTLPDIIFSVLNVDNSQLSTSISNMPESIQLILKKALRANLSDRYDNIQAMLNDLRLASNQQDELLVTTIANSNLHGDYGKENQVSTWDDESLTIISSLLMPYLGPIAPKLTKHIANQVNDHDSLRQRLGEHIKDDAAQKLFFHQFDEKREEIKLISSSRSSAKSVSDESAQSISERDLVKLKSIYTSYIGPIAGTMIRRKSKNANSLAELCQKLSENLDNERARERFLNEIKTLFQ